MARETAELPSPSPTILLGAFGTEPWGQADLASRTVLLGGFGTEPCGQADLADADELLLDEELVDESLELEPPELPESDEVLVVAAGVLLLVVALESLR